LDPYYKRPIKRGEIGCFLSHYWIWKQVVERELSRVIVFEDDIRFTENATRIMHGMVEDLMKQQTDWDLIYLGRKKNNANAKEFFVQGHRYLSTVTYSYWTLGYALSRQGAQKLLDARPLDKLLALDEFLPILYNQHPNEDWNSYFPKKDLLAFTVYPLAVLPMRYTNEPGYLSDTEDSILLNSTTKVDNDGDARTAVNFNIGVHAKKHNEL
jgi:collagen beta-1,O-galactosyltransferase